MEHHRSAIQDMDIQRYEQIRAALYPLALRRVYTLKLASWAGQEKDLAQDIVHTALCRVLARQHKAERGQMREIASLERISYTTAMNYCTDLYRRDKRLCRMEAMREGNTAGRDIYHVSEHAIENVYQSQLFRLLAPEIARFPLKQREALLIDLANHMHFGAQPTALQQAFLDAGIQLRDYRQRLPVEGQERARYNSLLNHAYKRLKAIPCIQRYMSGE